MSTNEGNCGVGARHYGDELALLRGVLASEDDRAVYPDNYCLQCVRAGLTDEKCFHRHWEVADEVAPTERRDTIN